MRIRKILLITLIFACVACECIASPGLPGLHDKFQESVFEHIKTLCSFGMRYVGSKSESMTVNYISNYLEKIGVNTVTEKFKFHQFDLHDITTTINGKTTGCDQILINPYNYRKFNGEGVIYDPNLLSQNDLGDKIVLVPNTENIYQLLDLKVKAAISLGENVIEDIGGDKDLEVNVDLTGKKYDLTSYNIIGSINPTHPTNKELIISAHWDSYKGPGASDNASGVGVLLELARYYVSIKDFLPCTIKFVALGAEELGLIGAKAYVLKHSKELEHCILLFNIDEVGGDQDIYIEMKDGESESKNNDSFLEKDIFAMRDYKGKWFLNSPFPIYANVPDWLKDNINKTCTELNYKFTPGNGMGSDHEIFAQHGIPSTNICIVGNLETHSPEDAPDKIDIDALRKTGEIVASVINKTITQGNY